MKTKEDNEKIFFGKGKTENYEVSEPSTSNQGSSEVKEKSKQDLNKKEQDKNNQSEYDKYLESNFSRKIVNEIIANSNFMKTYEKKEKQEKIFVQQSSPLIQNKISNWYPPKMEKKHLIQNNLNNKNKNRSSTHQNKFQFLKNNFEKDLDKQIQDSSISKRKNSE